VGARRERWKRLCARVALDTLPRGRSSAALDIARSRAVTFADIIENLRRYDEEPFGGQAPTIYVADPWAPSSDATVEWSGEKGGVPFRRKPVLFHLISVREALKFFGTEYDDLLAQGEVEGMCRKLATHITARNAARVRRDV
jgi:hypothetical protein